MITLLQIIPESKSTRMVWNGRVGRSTVNSVSISKRCGRVCLIIATNDREVRLYRLPQMDLEQARLFPVCMNYAVLSPNGNMLVAVGDSVDTFLFNLEEPGFSLQATWREAKDFGFTSDWHPNNSIFAVGTQDGMINVWDIRKASYSEQEGQTLAKFQSSQTPTINSTHAVRSVQFSCQNSVDLLLCCEQSSFVSVIDCRYFQDRQTIRVNESNPLEVDIAGGVFSPSGESLFVSMAHSIDKYSIDLLSRRSYGYYSFHLGFKNKNHIRLLFERI